MKPPAKESLPKSRLGGGPTFSLATLLIVVVVLSIGFAIMYYTVGLSVAYLIIASLALLRVTLHSRTAWAVGWGGSIGSIVLMIALLPVCCGAAFFTNCLAGGIGVDKFGVFHGSTVALFAVGLGALTSLQFAELIVALCLRKRASHESP